MKKVLTLSITREQECLTIEQLLKRELHLSRREISRAKFQEKGICLNGRQVRVNQKGKEGDVLTVSFAEEKVPSDILPLTEGMLSVLYEDEDLLIVNKPALIPTQPTGRHAETSLCNQVYAYMQKQEQDPCIRPVGRLDLETSGALVFAKNQIAAARLFAQRETGDFEKVYEAFVAGKLQKAKGMICAPIGPLPGKEGRERIKMQVCPQGKPAVTIYETIKEYHQGTLVRVWLRTGRTHQIRVHMSSLGHPLLGDQLYAPAKDQAFGFQRAALHAREVRLRHPFSGEKLQIQAPYPEDFAWLVNERKESPK